MNTVQNRAVTENSNIESHIIVVEHAVVLNFVLISYLSNIAQC